VIAIDTSAGAFTFNVVEPVAEPKVAVMTVLPCARVIAKPLLFIEDTLGALEVHVTLLVTFCVVPFV
jgi:hypothetical protein